MSDVVTGEAVALELPVANFPSRIAALLLDMLVQIVAFIVIIVIATASGPVSSDYAAAVFVTAVVLVIVAYPTAFETLSRARRSARWRSASASSATTAARCDSGRRWCAR